MKTLAVLLIIWLLSSVFKKKNKTQDSATPSTPSRPAVLEDYNYDYEFVDDDEKQSYVSHQTNTQVVNNTNKETKKTSSLKPSQPEVKKNNLSKDKFDVKKAIIYSTILDRPYK